MDEAKLLHVLHEVGQRGAMPGFSLGHRLARAWQGAVAAINLCNPGRDVIGGLIALQLRDHIRMDAEQSHLAVPMIDINLPNWSSEVADHPIRKTVVEPAGASHQPRHRPVYQAHAVAEPLDD